VACFLVPRAIGIKTIFVPEDVVKNKAAAGNDAPAAAGTFAMAPGSLLNLTSPAI
jgi:hypothetical protein